MIHSPTPVRAPESDGRKSPLNAFIMYLRVFISTQLELEVKSRPWGLRNFCGSFPRVPSIPSLQPTKDWAVLIFIPGCQLSTWVALGRVENTVSGLESGRCLLCK